jgi:hypothetical protein
MMNPGTTALMALAALDGGVGRPRPTAASLAAWDSYQRPGTHKSAKASVKANKKRKMEKATKKAQRKRK